MNRDDLRKRIRKAFVKRGHGYAHMSVEDIQKVCSEMERQVLICIQNNEEVRFRGFFNITYILQAGRRFADGMKGSANHEWMIKPGVRSLINLSSTLQGLARGDKSIADLQVISQKQRQRFAVAAKKAKKNV